MSDENEALAISAYDISNKSMMLVASWVYFQFKNSLLC